MGEKITASKAWDWERGREPVWLTPSEESHWLAARWKDAGYRGLLDLGCGLGRHSIFFARHGFRVDAMDLSPEGVRNLDDWKAREGLDIRTHVGDMLRLPYADGAFDCVFAYHVISHTDTAGFRRVLGEIDRVLRPGGEFYVTLCSKETWSFSQAGFPRIDENSVLKTEGAEKDVPHFYVSLDDVIALFGRFDILKIRHIDDCWYAGKKHTSKHFFILGKKKAG
jgi:SAM-dependent methyltransferase